MIYLYDGSYAGLLTVLYRIFARRQQPTDIRCNPPTQEELFEEIYESATDEALAGRLSRAIDQHLSPETMDNLRNAFLSEQTGREMVLYHYLKLGWRVRRDLDRRLTDDAVARVHQWARSTTHEAHRLKGLLRFRETVDGLMYAPVRSDADVLVSLARHFALRLKDCSWLIHDVSRDKGALFNGRRWVIGTLSMESEPFHSTEEEQWQALWRTFYDHIAIPERTNPLLQRSFMPMKYWEFLVEKPPKKAT